MSGSSRGVRGIVVPNKLARQRNHPDRKPTRTPLVDNPSGVRQLCWAEHGNLPVGIDRSDALRLEER